MEIYQPGDRCIIQENQKEFIGVISYQESDTIDYPYYVGVCECHRKEFNVSAERILRKVGEPCS